MRAVYHTSRRLVPQPLRGHIGRALRDWPNRYVRQAGGALWRELQSAYTTRHSARAFGALQGRSGLQVNLGCGKDIRAGWVNIDLGAPIGQPPSGATGRPVFINHDLRLGLPLAAGSCRLIYSSHFFEHLPYKTGLALMTESYRALQPGGIFRISLPNLRRMFAAYLDNDAPYFALLDAPAVSPDVVPGTETLVDFVNYGVYQFGEHHCIYDEEKLTRVLQSLGFRSVRVSAYQAGLDPAEPVRTHYSFYMEAVK